MLSVGQNIRGFEKLAKVVPGQLASILNHVDALLAAECIQAVDLRLAADTIARVETKHSAAIIDRLERNGRVRQFPWRDPLDASVLLSKLDCSNAAAILRAITDLSISTSILSRLGNERQVIAILRQWGVDEVPARLFATLDKHVATSVLNDCSADEIIGMLNKCTDYNDYARVLDAIGNVDRVAALLEGSNHDDSMKALVLSQVHAELAKDMLGKLTAKASWFKSMLGNRTHASILASILDKLGEPEHIIRVLDSCQDCMEVEALVEFKARVFSTISAAKATNVLRKLDDADAVAILSCMQEKEINLQAFIDLLQNMRMDTALKALSPIEHHKLASFLCKFDEAFLIRILGAMGAKEAAKIANHVGLDSIQSGKIWTCKNAWALAGALGKLDVKDAAAIFDKMDSPAKVANLLCKLNVLRGSNYHVSFVRQMTDKDMASAVEARM
eukprot:TRINITY_DN22069_c0_g1_i2.p1 TRINITY_DN22069_c0_g1~~TRINITY_DN22069_c0_g1_i2.p1  ORF type:complete len:515 (-),score=81.43 TRINITY_DN22069_c0_g1_i2:30-1367(-)